MREAQRREGDEVSSRAEEAEALFGDRKIRRVEVTKVKDIEGESLDQYLYEASPDGVAPMFWVVIDAGPHELRVCAEEMVEDYDFAVEHGHWLAREDDGPYVTGAHGRKREGWE